ncbi:MAG: NAD(P)H-hydrate dehydratase [Candidatus Omnitrophica bacterium]|nr:NAD(P)H-hydrate dehydratase [Candidatus Omnitrophota bacterium]
MAKVLKKRKKGTHKGDYGHVLVVAGSTGMTGAAYLTSEAALFMGSGLVTCAIPKSLNEIMEKKLTEVMTLPVEDRGRGYFSLASRSRIKDFSKKTDVAAIGPGLSQRPDVKKLVRDLVLDLDVPIVLDADGINCIADRADILKKVKRHIVITPHPGEMSRLTKKRVDKIQKNRKIIADEVARKYGVTVVLKGNNTIVSSPGKKTYVNKTGNPGMASAGTGDVLTGMIASLIGQGYAPHEAAKMGVYLHGLAGDIAAKKRSEASLRARDVLENIHEAIRK